MKWLYMCKLLQNVFSIFLLYTNIPIDVKLKLKLIHNFFFPTFFVFTEIMKNENFLPKSYIVNTATRD